MGDWAASAASQSGSYLVALRQDHTMNIIAPTTKAKLTPILIPTTVGDALSELELGACGTGSCRDVMASV